MLDSTWVDLHTEYIIWYTLVHFFNSYELIKKSIDLKLYQEIVLKHTILYVHCVNLLICSPTKFYFLFYDSFVIYYDLSKIQQKQKKIKKKVKPCTVAKPPSKTTLGVICPVLKSSGGKKSGFIGWGWCVPPLIVEGVM